MDINRLLRRSVRTSPRTATNAEPRTTQARFSFRLPKLGEHGRGGARGATLAVLSLWLAVAANARSRQNAEATFFETQFPPNAILESLAAARGLTPISDWDRFTRVQKTLPSMLPGPNRLWTTQTQDFVVASNVRGEVDRIWQRPLPKGEKQLLPKTPEAWIDLGTGWRGLVAWVKLPVMAKPAATHQGIRRFKDPLELQY